MTQKTGVQVSQLRAEELKNKGYNVFLSSESGFYVQTDNITREKYTYEVYKTGDKEVSIPFSARPY